MTHNAMANGQMKIEKGQMGKLDKWGSCNSNDTQYNGEMKRHKWGSCNLNDTQCMAK